MQVIRGLFLYTVRPGRNQREPNRTPRRRGEDKPISYHLMTLIQLIVADKPKKPLQHSAA
jgi:hypothetical protein